MNANLNGGIYLNCFTEVLKLRSSIYTFYDLYKNTEIFLEKYMNKELELKTEEELEKVGSSELDKEERAAIISSIFDLEKANYEARDILSQFLIVATFSFYEKCIKKIFELSRELVSPIITDSEIKNCSLENNTEKLFVKIYDINYSCLDDYHLVENELRYLNNSIKHTGKVSVALANANSRWITGNKIENNLIDDFERLKDGPYNLLLDFLEQLKLWNKNNNTIQDFK